MTETPPIIDRLDEKRGIADDAIAEEFSLHGRDSQQPQAVEEWLAELSAAYPDLRALVLRLQEERDRIDKSLFQVAQDRDMVIQAQQQLREERDALLEALKWARTLLRPHDTSDLAVVMDDLIAKAEVKNE